MRTPALSRPAKVCLFSFHPLVFQEVERLLSTAGFQLQARRIDPDGTTVPGGLAVPRASVYLVDAHARRSGTEELVAAILRRYASARVVVMGEKFSEANAFPLLRLGAKGLIAYAEASLLPRALKEVARGGYWVPRSLLSRFVDKTLSGTAPRLIAAGKRELTRREREVLAGLLENLSNKEIAQKFHISERTAKFHVSNLLAKYGVKRRADLILLNFSQPGER